MLYIGILFNLFFLDYAFVFIIVEHTIHYPVSETLRTGENESQCFKLLKDSLVLILSNTTKSSLDVVELINNYLIQPMATIYFVTG